MKKFLLSSLLTTLNLSMCVYCFSQTIPRTAVIPNSTYSPSIQNGLNPIPNSPNVCDYTDIRIFPSNNPQSEIHLSINKRNPQALLLSSQTYFINNSVQGAYWSTNGGTNWTGSDNLPNGAFGRGDPSTAFDAAGNGYVSTMNAPSLTGNPNGYLIQKTTNNGASWLSQVNATGVINNFDKVMIAADDVQGSPFSNNLYAAWSILNTDPSTNSVQFNRSTNQANSFTTPIILKTGWGQGTNVQTGPNGEVYVCWADYNNSYADWTSKGLGFCRSTNGGTSFTTPLRVINYTGIRTLNPMTGDDENPLFNGIRVNDFPAMAVDKSNGSHRGRIYVTLPVKENGNGKAVIQLSFSDNQGTTWSLPMTVSIANGRQNWFPWTVVDDTNGNLYITYYSFDGATGFSTNTYVAESDDGGATFTNKIVSDVSHITSSISGFGGGYAGDYIGITAYGGKGYAAWMDNRSGQWQNYISQVSSGNPVPNGTSGYISNCSVNNFNVLNTSLSAVCSAGVSINFNYSIIDSKYSNFVWTPVSVPSGASWHASGGNLSMYVTTPTTQGSNSETIALSATGPCGVYNVNFTSTAVYVGGFNFAVAPNPTQDNVTVSSGNNQTLTKNSSQNLIYAIKITDDLGTLRKSFEYKSGVTSTRISLTELNSGLYLMSVFDGTKWSSTQLVIQK